MSTLSSAATTQDDTTTTTTNTTTPRRSASAHLARTARVVFVTYDFEISGAVMDVSSSRWPQLLAGAESVFVRTAMSSGRSRWADIRPRLCADAVRMVTEVNAGGSSARSEALSMEILKVMFQAKLSKTEMQLQYVAGSKITDYSVHMFGHTVGVSVTRALNFKDAFSVDDAVRLLTKKLSGIIASSQNCINEQWTRQILHVFVESPAAAEALALAWELVGAELRSNTIVLATVADRNRFGWLYFENRTQ